MITGTEGFERCKIPDTLTIHWRKVGKRLTLCGKRYAQSENRRDPLFRECAECRMRLGDLIDR